MPDGMRRNRRSGSELQLVGLCWDGGRFGLVGGRIGRAGCPWDEMICRQGESPETGGLKLVIRW